MKMLILAILVTVVLMKNCKNSENTTELYNSDLTENSENKNITENNNNNNNISENENENITNYKYLSNSDSRATPLLSSLLRL